MPSDLTAPARRPRRAGSNDLRPALVALLAAAVPALADRPDAPDRAATLWTTGSGGWYVPGNWDNGVPTLGVDASFSTAAFNYPAAFTVDLDFNSFATFGPAGALSLLVDAGVSFEFESSNLTVNDSAIFLPATPGNSNLTTLSSRSAGSFLSALDIFVDRAVAVRDGVDFIARRDLTLGFVDPGRIDLTDGARLRLSQSTLGDARIVIGSGADGEVTLDDTSQLLTDDPAELFAVGSDAGVEGRLLLRGSAVIDADAVTFGREGRAVLELADGAYLETGGSDAVLAEQPGSDALVTLSDDAAWFTFFHNISTGRGASTILVLDTARIDANTLLLAPNATLGGDGLVRATVENAGLIAPGRYDVGSRQDTAALTIDSNYFQDALIEGSFRPGSLSIRYEQTPFGVVQNDLLDVFGVASLRGTLILSRRGAALSDPLLLDGRAIVTSPFGLAGAFDAVLAPDLPDGYILGVEYLPTDALLDIRSGSSVGGISLDNPLFYTAGVNALPRDLAFADLDNDGDDDAVLLYADPVNPTSANGQIVVIPAENDPAGFIGFLAPQPVSVGLGVDPRALALGDVNNDGAVDIAAAYAGDPNASQSGDVAVIYADPAAPGDFSAVGVFEQRETVRGRPRDIGLADFNNNGVLGVAVTSDGDDAVTILKDYPLGPPPIRLARAGADRAADIDDIDIPDDIDPDSVQPGDLNADGRADLVYATLGFDQIAVLLDDGSGGYSAPVYFPVGGDPVEFTLGDYDNDPDGRLDIVTVNETGNSISVILNESTPGVLQLGSASSIPLATEPALPRSIATDDLDSDGDDDLVLVLNAAPAPIDSTDGRRAADRSLDASVVLPLRNEGTTGTAFFVRGDAVPVGDNLLAIPRRVRTGDVNGDGLADVGALNAALAGPTPADELAVLLAAAPCPGDANGDGRTDVGDFFILASSFGQPDYDPRADLNRDGGVDVSDFFLLAGAFGCDRDP